MWTPFSDFERKVSQTDGDTEIVIHDHDGIIRMMHSLTFRRGEILRNQKREPSVDDAIAYFDSMATYIDELRKLQRELRYMIR